MECYFKWNGKNREWLVAHSYLRHEWRVRVQVSSVSGDCGGAFYFCVLGIDNITGSGAARNAKNKSLHLLQLSRAYQIEFLTRIQMPDIVQTFAARVISRESCANPLEIHTHYHPIRICDTAPVHNGWH